MVVYVTLATMSRVRFPVSTNIIISFVFLISTPLQTTLIAHTHTHTHRQGDTLGGVLHCFGCAAFDLQNCAVIFRNSNITENVVYGKFGLLHVKQQGKGILALFWTLHIWPKEVQRDNPITRFSRYCGRLPIRLWVGLNRYVISI